MPDPRISDDELDALTRAYLHRRSAQPVPPDLKASAIAAAVSPRPKRLLLAAPLFAATLVVVGSVLAAALMLNHQGPASSGSPPPLVQKTPSPTSVPSPSATYTPPGVTPGPTPLPLLGPACSTRDLAVRVGVQGGAGGNGITYLVFTDTGLGPCTLDGTPEVEFLGASGATLNSPPVVDRATGAIPTIPNHGVGLQPISDQGATGTAAITGQAVLPLQYQDACSSAIATVSITLANSSLTAPLTLSPYTVPSVGPCTVVYINPFQPPAA